MEYPTRCGLAALAVLLTSCDPLQSRALNLAPAPPDRGQVAERVTAIAAEVAARNGMHPHPSSPYQGEEGWTCHIRGAFRMCSTALAGEAQFLFTENGFSFSPVARTVWEQIGAELRSEFGATAVRECRLVRRSEPETAAGEGGRQRHVCVPLVR